VREHGCPHPHDSQHVASNTWNKDGLHFHSLFHFTNHPTSSDRADDIQHISTYAPRNHVADIREVAPVKLRPPLPQAHFPDALRYIATIRTRTRTRGLSSNMYSFPSAAIARAALTALVAAATISSAAAAREVRATPALTNLLTTAAAAADVADSPGAAALAPRFPLPGAGAGTTGTAQPTGTVNVAAADFSGAAALLGLSPAAFRVGAYTRPIFGSNMRAFCAIRWMVTWSFGDQDGSG